jgi:hypothetical protein
MTFTVTSRGWPRVASYVAMVAYITFNCSRCIVPVLVWLEIIAKNSDAK